MVKCIRCDKNLNLEDRERFYEVTKKWYSCECGYCMTSLSKDGIIIDIEWSNENGEEVEV